MNNKTRCIAFFCALMSMSWAVLADDSALYGGRTWWDDQAGIEDAASRVLPQVLVKLTGSPSVPNQWHIETLQGQLQDMVLRYHTINAPLASDTRKWVWIQLDPDRLNKLIDQHKQVPWTTSRPRTLIWFVLDHDGRQDIFGADMRSELVDQLHEALDQRSLVSVFPAMDDKDKAFYQSGALWSFNIPDIRKASRRYHPEQILVVKAVYQPYDAHWHATQLLVSDAINTPMKVDSPSLTQLLVQIADRALAQTYASMALIDSLQQQSSAKMQIVGVSSSDTYHNVLAFLNNHKKVKNVVPYALSADEITVELDLLGASSHFFRQLMASKSIQFLKTTTDVEGNKLWQYRWPQAYRGGQRD